MKRLVLSVLMLVCVVECSPHKRHSYERKPVKTIFTVLRYKVGAALLYDGGREQQLQTCLI
jgi:hypothetical protein